MFENFVDLRFRFNKIFFLLIFCLFCLADYRESPFQIVPRGQYKLGVSPRGALHVIFGGFRYGRMNYINPTPGCISQWRCTKSDTARKSRCNVYGKILEDNSFLIKGVHLHPPSPWFGRQDRSFLLLFILFLFLINFFFQLIYSLIL